jgi:hypothetical protein
MIISLAALPAAATNETTHRKAHPYRDDWKHSTFGKGAATSAVGGAAMGQATGHPKNYGGGAGGFGKRVGAGFATHAVGSTVHHAVAAPLHENLHYERSNKRGFGPRLGHALSSTVIARNTKTGKHQAAVGRLSGHAASGAFSQVAMHAGSGAATAGVAIGAEAGVNVAKEFWPMRHGERASHRQ